MKATCRIVKFTYSHINLLRLRDKLAHIIMLALLATIPSTAADYSPPLAGLVGWWRGENNGNDASGHGHNGTLNSMAFGAGAFGQAFSFVGSANRVVVPDSPEFNLTNALTIGAWIYPTADCWHILARSGSTGSSVAYQCGLDLGSGFLFYIKPEAPAPADSLSLRAPILYNRWTHVTATFDGNTGNMRVYMDGVMVAQKTTTNRPSADLGGEPISLAIGNAPFGGFPFIGLLDELVLYSRALSPAEVQSLGTPFCTPHKAAATPVLVNGFVVGATITDGGCGYTNAPLVLIQGGGGSGATATATVNNGTVTSVNIVSAGSGYSTNPAPKIVIASPPFEPSVGIRFSRVEVTQHVTLGRNYVLESSTNLVSWVATSTSFNAVSENYTNEFVIGETGGFFRLREVP